MDEVSIAALVHAVDEFGALFESICGHNALPFNGAPEDIAQAMLFLASDDSRYVTGQVLVVDGGMSSHSAIAEDRRAVLPTRTDHDQQWLLLTAQGAARPPAAGSG